MGPSWPVLKLSFWLDPWSGASEAGTDKKEPTNTSFILLPRLHETTGLCLKDPDFSLATGSVP